jgi:hypothetical protein
MELSRDNISLKGIVRNCTFCVTEIKNVNSRKCFKFLETLLIVLSIAQIV